MQNGGVGKRGTWSAERSERTGADGRHFDTHGEHEGVNLPRSGPLDDWDDL